MEEGLGKVLMQGVELGWSEEGDRGEGATLRRAVELRSALDEMRRKRELTSGSHIRPDKYLAMPRGLSASLERTVREVVVTSLLTSTKTCAHVLGVKHFFLLIRFFKAVLSIYSWERKMTRSRLDLNRLVRFVN